MADVKISGLPASTTPLAGTEVLPIVQSGVTKQVANNDLRPKQIQSNATSGVLQVVGPASAATRVMTTPDANFSAARIDAAQSFTGNQTLSTGNLVIGTSGKGIDFSATAGTGTSELFDDYEEGTWTPFVYGGTVNGSGTYTAQSGKYTKIGDCVYYYVNLAWSAHTGSGALFVGGLPYTVANPTQCNGTFLMDVASGVGRVPMFQLAGNTTTVQLLSYNQTTGAAGTIALPATSAYFILQGYYLV